MRRMTDPETINKELATLNGKTIDTVDFTDNTLNINLANGGKKSVEIAAGKTYELYNTMLFVISNNNLYDPTKLKNYVNSNSNGKLLPGYTYTFIEPINLYAYGKNNQEITLNSYNSAITQIAPIAINTASGKVGSVEFIVTGVDGDYLMNVHDTTGASVYHDNVYQSLRNPSKDGQIRIMTKLTVTEEVAYNDITSRYFTYSMDAYGIVLAAI